MVITINEDGTLFEGLDRADQVTILANNVTAYGNDGNDLISAAIYIEPTEETDIGVALYGGRGNDVLSVDFGFNDTTGTPLVSLTGVVDGGSGNDAVYVQGEGEDLRWTNAEISGGDGADSLTFILREWEMLSETRESSRRIVGGEGDDQLFVDVYSVTAHVDNVLRGDEGSDEIVAIAASVGDWGGDAFNHVRGGMGDDTIDVEARTHIGRAENIVHGDGGNDRIEALSQGLNDLHGGAGDDVITAKIATRFVPEDSVAFSELTNIVQGDEGDDHLSGQISLVDYDGIKGDFHSELLGGAGDDRLSVKGGEGNILNGGTGDDVLLGGGGSDTLIGLGGDDYLRGRGGEDIFLFGAIRNGERDRVVDFTISEDKIDLSQIDANVNRNGNQSFGFGTREGTGRAWVEQSNGSSSLLHADTGGRELIVVLQDGADIAPGDYSASDFLL